MSMHVSLTTNSAFSSCVTGKRVEAASLAFKAEITPCSKPRDEFPLTAVFRVGFWAWAEFAHRKAPATRTSKYNLIFIC
jgi:hypothetical protein